MQTSFHQVLLYYQYTGVSEFNNIRVLRCVLDYYLYYFENSGEPKHAITGQQAKEAIPKAVACSNKRYEVMKLISNAGIERNEYTNELTQCVYAITTVIIIIIK